jgi:Tol biopolymer transport system component
VIGKTIGPYHLSAMLGAGGMGEVYRAHDSRLGRDVALKILPDVFARDAERLARFRREAHVLASLNHPNIAHVYGLEDSDGAHALVMELVDGPTLADLIEGGRAIDDAWAIARQIAEALHAAHQQGIVHRDLKPANIKVRPDGTVKVLDFGLAKALEPASASAAPGQALSHSPTITSPVLPDHARGMTRMGMILGTAAYMSPEQARGKAVDSRADIWAFGCVFYEMLTGRRLFGGDDLTDVLASVLKEQPDISGAPPSFRRLLGACLERDPQARLQSIGDARLLIGDSPATAGRRATLPSAIAAGAVVLLAFAIWAPWNRATLADLQDLSIVLAPPGSDWMWGPLSPDGTRLLQLTGDKSARVLTFATGDERELPGTEGISLPFWSPDGRWIGFFKGGNLLVTPSTGGPSQMVCERTGNFFGASWHPNGTVLVASQTGPIRMVRVVNGVADGACTAVQPESSEAAATFPEWLPDGERFLFVRGNPGAGAAVFLTSIRDPSSRRILPDASSVTYAPPHAGESTGHLLFRRGSRLMAQAFDAHRGMLQGDPVELAGNVTTVFNPFRSSASVSSNGLLAYATLTGTAQLTWMDRQGRATETVAPPGDYGAISVSPDGSRIGFRRGDELWTLQLANRVETRVDAVFSSLVWSPDGNWFARWAPDRGLVRQPAGGGAIENLIPGRPGARPSQWTHDKLLFTDTIEAQGDLGFLPNPGAPGSQPVAILTTPANEGQGQLSPDGRWLAYTSDEGGSSAVYVCRFPECSGRQKLPGTAEPHWNANGRELFWLRLAADGMEIMTATVRTDTTFSYDPPRILFRVRGGLWTPQLNFYFFAPSPDGQRFLLPLYGSDVRFRMHLVTNWRRLLQNPGTP